jgi:hypothetical protein
MRFAQNRSDGSKWVPVASRATLLATIGNNFPPTVNFTANYADFDDSHQE